MKEGKQNLEEILEKNVENISDNTREDVSNQKYIDKIKGITILTKKYKDKKGCVENKGISLNEMKETLQIRRKAFEIAGGRSIYLAESIDLLEQEIEKIEQPKTLRCFWFTEDEHPKFEGWYKGH